MRPFGSERLKRLRPPTFWELLALIIGLVGLIQAETHYASIVRLLGSAFKSLQ